LFAHSPTLTLPRYTQDNVIDKGQKKRAQVFGEPVAINDKQVRDSGYQVRQMDALIKAHGIPTRLVIRRWRLRPPYVTDPGRTGSEPPSCRRTTRSSITAPGCRAARWRPYFSGGRIRPRIRFVPRARRQPGGCRLGLDATATLAKGMRTFDTIENRGFILVGPPAVIHASTGPG
jgi:hypothetical protein